MNIFQLLRTFTLRKVDFSTWTNPNAEVIPHDRMGEANLVCSDPPEGQGLDKNEWAYPVLDIDLPCVLLDSTHPDKHHLFILQPVKRDKFRALLQALVDCGLYNKGNLKAFDDVGFVGVRTPWTPKEWGNTESEEMRDDAPSVDSGA